MIAITFPGRKYSSGNVTGFMRLAVVPDSRHFSPEQLPTVQMTNLTQENQMVNSNFEMKQLRNPL